MDNPEEEKKEVKKEEEEIKPHEHRYAIIPGSGKITGTPKWKCILCPQTVEAS